MEADHFDSLVRLATKTSTQTLLGLGAGIVLATLTRAGSRDPRRFSSGDSDLNDNLKRAADEIAQLDRHSGITLVKDKNDSVAVKNSTSWDHYAHGDHDVRFVGTLCAYP